MLLSTLGTLLLSSIAGLVTAQQQSATPPSNGSTPVASHYASTFKNMGGKTLSGNINVYLIFYGNWTTPELATEQTTMLDFIDHVSSSSWFGLFNEYIGTGATLNLAAALTDAGSHGLQLANQAAHQQIVSDAIQSGFLSATNEVDPNGVYVIMAGSNVNDNDFCRISCGYNSYTDQFQYMYIGYPTSCPNKCLPEPNTQQSPNQSPAIDAAITIFSHEIQDVLTDPRGDAWVLHPDQSTTLELGDFCAGDGVDPRQWFGSVSQVDGNNSPSYNLMVNDKKYLVQTIFSKAKNACLLS